MSNIDRLSSRLVQSGLAVLIYQLGLFLPVSHGF
jgi:hypothetical protein